MHKVIASLATASTVALTLGLSNEARADHLEACGGVYFEALAEGSCEVVPVEQCTTRCEVVATEKVCAARLYHACEGSCTAEASVECNAGCEETCVPNCETVAVDQPPNCMGLCMSQCQMDATAECEGNPDHGKCRSSGAQCCSEYCHAECDAAAEETTCEPVCQTACSGSCEGGANVECQVQCQAQLFTDCETTTVQECNDECMTTGAAIFCDGQFLATSGDLKACADEIAAQFSIELDVDVDVDVDVDCQGDACEGEGDLDADSDGRLSCGASIDPQGNHRWLAFGLLMLGLGLFPIRRRS